MREIKFRAKRTTDGKWVYGSFAYWWVVDGKMCHCIIENNPAPELSYIHSVNTDTLGQYTGLKDMNGKEIYEGDIVAGKTLYPLDTIYTEKGVVTYREDSALYTLGLTDILGNYVSVQVIGNIHDNPELLKQD